MQKKHLKEGIEALEKVINSVLKDEDLEPNKKMRFAKKADNGLRELREAIDYLEE